MTSNRDSEAQQQREALIEKKTKALEALDELRKVAEVATELARRAAEAAKGVGDAATAGLKLGRVADLKAGTKLASAADLTAEAVPPIVELVLSKAQSGAEASAVSGTPTASAPAVFGTPTADAWVAAVEERVAAIESWTGADAVGAATTTDPKAWVAAIRERADTIESRISNKLKEKLDGAKTKLDKDLAAAKKA